MIGSLSAAAQSRSNPCNWKQRMRRQENGRVHIPWKIIWPCFPWNILKTIYSGDAPLTFVRLIAADNTFQQHADVCSSHSTLTFSFRTLTFHVGNVAGNKRCFFIQCLDSGAGSVHVHFVFSAFDFCQRNGTGRGNRGCVWIFFPPFSRLQPLNKHTR